MPAWVASKSSKKTSVTPIRELAAKWVAREIGVPFVALAGVEVDRAKAA